MFRDQEVAGSNPVAPIRQRRIERRGEKVESRTTKRAFEGCLLPSPQSPLSFLVSERPPSNRARFMAFAFEKLAVSRKSVDFADAISFNGERFPGLHAEITTEGTDHAETKPEYCLVVRPFRGLSFKHVTQGRNGDTRASRHPGSSGHRGLWDAVYRSIHLADHRTALLHWFRFDAAQVAYEMDYSVRNEGRSLAAVTEFHQRLKSGPHRHPRTVLPRSCSCCRLRQGRRPLWRFHPVCLTVRAVLLRPHVLQKP